MADKEKGRGLSQGECSHLFPCTPDYACSMHRKSGRVPSTREDAPMTEADRIRAAAAAFAPSVQEAGRKMQAAIKPLRDAARALLAEGQKK